MYPHRTPVSLSAYLAFTAAFCLLGLFWLAQSVPTAHAQDQPEALGSLSGAMRNEQGDPLPNITVRLERYTSPNDNRSVTTDGEGVYRFLSVLPGGYRLRAEDTSGVYATRYYADAHFADDAQTVAVNGNDVSGIDMTLALGGSISVTIQTAAPLTSTYVTAYLYRQTASERLAIYRSPFWYLDQDETRFIGLPSGTYRLCIDIQPSFYTENDDFECYDNVLPDAEGLLPPNATDIIVQPGNETPITMAFGNLSQLEGFVRAPNGDPLGNISVRALSQNRTNSHYVMTDANGYFRFGYMRSDFYTLLFNEAYYYYDSSYPSSNGYLPSFYPNVFSWNDATFLEITSTSHHSLSVTLTPEAYITGKLMLPNNVPVTGYSSVSVFRQAPNGSWLPYGLCLYPDPCPIYPTIEMDSATGVYTATQLTPGHYRIGAFQSVDSVGIYLSAFYGGTTLEDADDIVVGAGQTVPEINIVLGENAFEGRLTGAVTVDGVPQAGIEVGMFGPYVGPLPVVYTYTDAQGRYLFEGLPAGYYRVAFHDPTGFYASTFYTGTEASFYNSLVEVPITGTVENINGSLTPGGKLSGRVRTPAGRSPADYTITLMDVNTFSIQPYSNGRTDKDGFFTITGVVPGSYFVSAQPPQDFGFNNFPPPRFYPGTLEPAGIPVTVEAGKERTGVDIYFTFAPSNFLPRVGKLFNSNNGWPPISIPVPAPIAIP